MKDAAVAVLLTASVLVTLLSVAGVVLFRDMYQRLHFVTPAWVIAPALVAAAVLVQETFNVRGLQTMVAIAAMVVLGPILSHATARAARVRYRGDWRISSRERSEG
jgi:multicomponent Na+:H+ antiporter subunit G